MRHTEAKGSRDEKEETNRRAKNDREREAALAFAEGREGHGCVVHVPDEIDVQAIREKIALSQSEFGEYPPDRHTHFSP